MADIKQAAKWMSEGKCVKRVSESGLNDTRITKTLAVFSDEIGMVCEIERGYPVWFPLAALMADDWEIAA